MAAKFVSFLAFMLVVGSGYALTCYKCDSTQNKLCAYGISSFTYSTVDCDQDVGGGSVFTNWIPKQCVKLVAQDKDGNEHIARSCMPHSVGACNAIAQTFSFFGSIGSDIKEMNCYPCDGDKCNSATKMGTYTFLGLLLAAIAFLF